MFGCGGLTMMKGSRCFCGVAGAAVVCSLQCVRACMRACFLGGSCHLAAGAKESSLELKQGRIPQWSDSKRQLCPLKTNEALRESRADILKGHTKPTNFSTILNYLLLHTVIL